MTLIMRPGESSDPMDAVCKCGQRLGEHSLGARGEYNCPGRNGTFERAEAPPTERPDWVKCALTGMRIHVVPVDEQTLRPIPGAEPIKTETREQRTWCGREAPVHEWTFTDASHAALASLQGSRMVLCPNCNVAIVRALWQALPEGEPVKVTSPAVQHLLEALTSKTPGNYELLRAFLIEKVGYVDFCRLQEQAFALRFDAFARHAVECSS